MSSNSIKVFSPASVSNVGPGFDILGFALNNPGDEIILRKTKRNGLRIIKITGDNKKLPLDINKNTASVAVLSIIKKYQLTEGISIQINKKMGLGSGLGSSAASAVGAVYALNKLLGLKLPKTELLSHALAGEFCACKAYHADNVAPSLFGGFVLIRSYNPLDVIKINTPSNLYCSIVYPRVIIKTKHARKILPSKIDLKKMIVQTGNLAGVIYGLSVNDKSLIKRSLHDVIVEPVRAALIPGFEDFKNAAINNGAIGCSISGSGPSIFALSDSKNTAINIINAFKKTSEKLNIKSLFYISGINKQGPKTLN